MIRNHRMLQNVTFHFKDPRSFTYSEHLAHQKPIQLQLIQTCAVFKVFRRVWCVCFRSCSDNQLLLRQIVIKPRKTKQWIHCFNTVWSVTIVEWKTLTSVLFHLQLSLTCTSLFIRCRIRQILSFSSDILWRSRILP